MDFDFVIMPSIFVAVAVLISWFSVRRVRLLSTRTKGTWRRVAKRIVWSIVLLFVIAIAGTSAFNAIALHRFWAKNPPAGRIVVVNHHRMHINCTGSGSPTLVLDAGLGDDSVIWGQIQPVLSETTRVCSYDRAGFGWSDAAPGPRDADHIAGELHQLLFQSGITAPVVLMGHSITGIYMRDYATRYRGDVAGLIFVDVTTPFQERNPAMRTGASGPPPWVLRLALITGVPRLLGMCSSHKQGADSYFWKRRSEDICRVHYGALSAEFKEFDQSSGETVHSGPYGVLPILIFSHDPLGSNPKGSRTKRDVDHQNAWDGMQEGLKKLSSRSYRIIVRGGTHHLFEERPGLIDKDVAQFINQIRGTAPESVVYGSTTTE